MIARIAISEVHSGHCDLTQVTSDLNPRSRSNSRIVGNPVGVLP